MKYYYVAIAGNIGVGKSTLTNLLSEELGWQPLYEQFEDNPYLSDFYKDMSRWGFHSQIYFLGRRIRQYVEIANSNTSVIQDRCIYEDAEIFARNLYLQGHIGKRDWKTYYELYQSLARVLPPPDLVVYLKASVHTLVHRIAIRGRSFEQSISASYLETLNSLYDEWASNYNLSPLLRINTDDMDFLHIRDHLDTIVHSIRQKLHGKDELDLQNAT